MRIQILPLPAVMVGDNLEEPFALVIDQCPHNLQTTPSSVRDAQLAEWAKFASDCGASAFSVFDDTIEIVDPNSGQEPRRTCLFCDDGDAAGHGADCSCSAPCWNPDCLASKRQQKPARSRYATDAVMFDKRVVIDWPDGPPPGVSRRDLQQTLEGYAQALAEHMAGKDEDAEANT